MNYTDTLYGSLVLYSNGKINPFALNLTVPHNRTGIHIVDRNKGSWHEATTAKPIDIYLPQRFKRMVVSCIGEHDALVRGLEELDSLWPGCRQLYKLGQLQAQLPDLTAVVNIASVESEVEPVSGSFYLFAGSRPLYVNLIFDADDQSVRLTWSTFDLKSTLVAHKYQRYILFPFPLLMNRSLFIHSQNICARWWNLRRKFPSDYLNVLRSANALEQILYKDPNVPNYS